METIVHFEPKLTNIFNVLDIIKTKVPNYALTKEQAIEATTNAKFLTSLKKSNILGADSKEGRYQNAVQYALQCDVLKPSEDPNENFDAYKNNFKMYLDTFIILNKHKENFDKNAFIKSHLQAGINDNDNRCREILQEYSRDVIESITTDNSNFAHELRSAGL